MVLTDGRWPRVRKSVSESWHSHQQVAVFLAGTTPVNGAVAGGPGERRWYGRSASCAARRAKRKHARLDDLVITWASRSPQVAGNGYYPEARSDLDSRLDGQAASVRVGMVPSPGRGAICGAAVRPVCGGVSPDCAGRAEPGAPEPAGNALGRFLRRQLPGSRSLRPGWALRAVARDRLCAGLGLPSARMDPWRLPGGGPGPEGRGCSAGVAFGHGGTAASLRKLYRRVARVSAGPVVCGCCGGSGYPGGIRSGRQGVFYRARGQGS